MDHILDILELSRKYAVSVMLTSCVDILKELFPSELEEYQNTIDKRQDLVSFRASVRCVMAANTYGLPTLLPACYLYIAGDYYNEIFSITKLSLWPADVPLTIYATIVRIMRQLTRVKRAIDEGFNNDYDNAWELRTHEHQTSNIIAYYRGPNNSGSYPAEDLNLFNPAWKATDIVSGRALDDLCDECIVKWDNSQRDAWVDAWNNLPASLHLESWQALRQQESQTSAAAS